MAPGILFDTPMPQVTSFQMASSKIRPSFCPKFVKTATKPTAWPTAVTGAEVWKGTDFASDGTKYTWRLTTEDVMELERGLDYFKDLELDGQAVDKETFPLPTLGAKLRQLAVELHSGKGFFVLHGLEPEKYSREDNILLFLGINAYIAESRGRQDDWSNMLVHLKHDKEGYPIQGEGPTRNSNKASPFHTDHFADILAFQVRGQAAKGGQLKLASTGYVYNQLRKERPELIELLGKSDWGFEARGRLFPAQIRPILFYQNKKIMLSFSRRPLMGPASPSPLSKAQEAALDEIERIASAASFAPSVSRGDLVFFHNNALLHSRTAFTDDDEAGQVRHVVRMWLKNEKLSWELPKELRVGNKRVYAKEGSKELEGFRRERWAVTGNEAPPSDAGDGNAGSSH